MKCAALAVRATKTFEPAVLRALAVRVRVPSFIRVVGNARRAETSCVWDAYVRKVGDVV